jgi:hypothetical protein
VASLTTANQQSLLAPIVVGQVVLGAQTAAIGSTTIVTNAPAGLYRLNYSLTVTSIVTSTLTANAIYTDAAKAETVAVLNGVAVTATGQFQGSLFIENIAAANLNYSVTLGGSGATWNLYILVERLF